MKTANKYEINNVCVYASSSDLLAPPYQEAARELGTAIGNRKLTLIYGAGQVGLMGYVARAVHETGGKVVGVIPELLHAREIAYLEADELIVTTGMRERKAIMENRGDAFIALPGGFGTLEEILEVLTLRQLHYHHKPIVFFNVLGFYSPLLECFERLFAEHFVHVQHRELYHVAHSVDEVFEYLDAFAPVEPEDKWYRQ
jgi:uncharacterized protein (TIGR00730 family)